MNQQCAISRRFAVGERSSKALSFAVLRSRARAFAVGALLLLGALIAQPAAAQSATTVTITGSKPATFARAGQVLTFNVQLWTGNTDISSLTFTSGAPGTPSLSCPGMPAALQTTTNCTFTYTTTSMDMAIGTISALGRWTATRPTGANRSGSTNTLVVSYAPPRQPDAPTINGAAAGNAQATVSFTPPDFDGGYPVDSYTVTSVPGGITAAGTASPLVVTGLTNGTSYRFSVTATNTIGTSAASAQSIAVTPIAPQTITFANPGAQTFGTAPTLTATATSGLDVSFSSSTTSVCTTGAGGTLAFVAAGTCTINADQPGNASFAAAPTVSRSFSVNAIAPGAPTVGTATAGDAQATIAFDAPAMTGGTAITGYTVTSSPGGLTANGAASPITVAGLDNGTAYTFTVAATNSAGTGVASSASNAVTPKAAQTITFANPGAQTFGTTPALTATSSAGLVVGFSSSSTGVCTITSGGTLTFVSAGTCTVDADQAGDAATNAATTVSRSFTVNAIAPGAPVIGTATAGDAAATVAFFAPASNGGAAVTNYTIKSMPGGITATGAASPITVTGLTNGVAYAFTVTATNSAGTSGASSASNVATPAAAQTITFNNPGAQNFGTTPTLIATASSGLAVAFSSTTTAVCTTTVAGSLTFVAAGTCTIAADQSGNASYQAASQVSRSFIVEAVAPGAPTQVNAVAADAQATVSFAAPATTGGSTITAYTVTSSPGGVTATGAGSPLVVAGLTNGTSYTFTVTATTSAGTGSASTASNAVTPLPPLTVGAVGASVPYAAGATPIALDIAGTATAVSIGTAPAHGTAIASGTTITYQPAAGYAGADSFTYTATDGFSTTAPAVVSVTVGDATISVTPSNSSNATAGVPYTQTFTWSGGNAPYVAYDVRGLPAGIAVTATSNTSVTVSGTPTDVGRFNVTVQARDSSTGNGPYTTAKTFTLDVATPALSLVPAAGALDASYGIAYRQTVVASGGTGPYTYAVTGVLPAGVTLSGATLSGTPTAPGSYTFTITATDTGSTGVGAPFTVSHAYTLQVTAPGITLSPSTLPAGTATSAYAQTLSAAGGIAPYTYGVVTGALPTGLALASDGTLSGTPTASGHFTFTVRATDAHAQPGTQDYTLDIAAPTLSLSPTTLANGTAGATYSQALTIEGGIAPYTTSLTGTLPTGLAFYAATRTLSGTPTQSGVFDLDVTVTDGTAGTPGRATAHYTLSIAAPTLTLGPTTAASGSAGVPYTQTFSASGGIAPYRYTLATGALPAGLSLDATTGALTGIPTAAGTFQFSIRATDSTTGTPASTTTAYTLALSAPTIAITPTALPAGLANTPYAQMLSAAGGTAPYRFVVTAGTLPAGLSLAPNGGLTGTPTADGAFAFTVTATDALGFTATHAYAFTVAPRPDPSRDADVRGVLDAQAQAAHRFADAQIRNFQSRLESLHGSGRDGGGVRNALTFADSARCSDNPHVADTCHTTRVERAGIGAADGGADTLVDASPSDSTASPAGLWIGGALRSGSTGSRSGSADLDFETDGLSVGADYRASNAFAFGAGLGFGRDASDIGTHDTRTTGRSYAVAAYASYHPGGMFFLDGVLGYQRLSFDLRRYVATNGATVTGSHDGTQWFGSLSTGADITRGGWQLTPYARVDISRASLDSYTERGDALYALHYGEQSIDTTTGDLGLRVGTRRVTSWGAFAPEFRVEAQHDFQGGGETSLRYADLPSGALYTTRTSGFDRTRYTAGAGATWVLHDDFSIRLEYSGVFGTSGDRDNGLQLYFRRSY